MKHTHPDGSADRLEAFLLQHQQAVPPSKASRAMAAAASASTVRAEVEAGRRSGFPKQQGVLQDLAAAVAAPAACSSAGAWPGTRHALLLHGPCLEPASPVHPSQQSPAQPQPGPVPQSAKPPQPAEPSPAPSPAQPTPAQTRSFETRLKTTFGQNSVKTLLAPNP